MCVCSGKGTNLEDIAFALTLPNFEAASSHPLGFKLFLLWGNRALKSPQDVWYLMWLRYSNVCWPLEKVSLIDMYTNY